MSNEVYNFENCYMNAYIQSTFMQNQSIYYIPIFWQVDFRFKIAMHCIAILVINCFYKWFHTLFMYSIRFQILILYGVHLHSVQNENTYSIRDIFFKQPKSYYHRNFNVTYRISVSHPDLAFRFVSYQRYPNELVISNRANDISFPCLVYLHIPLYIIPTKAFFCIFSSRIYCTSTWRKS